MSDKPKGTKYFSKDFDYEEHRIEMKAYIEKVLAEEPVKNNEAMGSDSGEDAAEEEEKKVAAVAIS